jgi:hypothetical protein
MNGRYAQSFLKDFFGHRHGAWRHASDIGVMGATGDIKTESLFVEYTGHERDIGEMRPAGIGIVKDHHIAGADIPSLDCGSNGKWHGAEMDRHVIPCDTTSPS